MSDIEVINYDNESAAALEKRTYVDIAESSGLDWVGRTIWASCGVSNLTQGWKLHISIVPTDALYLFERLFPLLEREQVPFKFIRSPAQLRTLNEGAFGETQIGKAVTIYPACDAQSLQLAERLIPLTTGLRGPEIITDLALGGTVYTRYGCYNPIVSRNRLGQMIHQIRFPDGKLRVDQYQAPYEIPEGLTHPFGEILSEHCQSSDAGGTKILGPGYLPLNVLRVSAKGAIFFALDLRSRNDAKYCVLKEGRKHTSSDAAGRDMRSRLQHQGVIQNLLKDVAAVPTVDAYFESPREHGYLPMEYIDGHDLEQTFGEYPYSSWSLAQKRARLEFFLRLFDAVSEIHNRGVIHRDLTPRNIRIAVDGRLYLLDFELAWQVGSPGAPFSQGTPGFVSPQQVNNDPPSLADDVYSLGSLLIWSLGNTDPQFLIAENRSDLEKRLAALVGAEPGLCNLIARCWEEIETDRPQISELVQGLRDEYRDVAHHKPRNRHSPIPEKEIVFRGLEGIMTKTPVSEHNGLWMSYLDQKPQRAGQVQHQTGGQMGMLRSLYRGVAGSVYTYSKFAHLGWTSPERNESITRAIDWLLQHEATRDDQLPGLYFGEAGVALAISHAVGAGIVESGEWFKNYLDEALRGPLDWPDLTHGAAGQGLAALACQDIVGQVVDFRALTLRAARFLVDCQTDDGCWAIPEGVPGMSGTIYTGFAHGVAGILYFLIRCDQHYPNSEIQKAWRHGLDWLDRMGSGQEASPICSWAVDNTGDESWFRWCHGAPGISLTYLAAFEATNNPVYAEKARSALAHFEANVRLTNYSTCCGLAGLGEIYLSAWQTLGNDKDLIRARRLGETLSSLAVPTAGNGLVWKVDNSPSATSDLMCGSGGVVHFLSRLYDQSSPPTRMPGLT